MRVIAQLPHPDCKITIFSMNQKYIIKFEKGIYEQTYKLAELDLPRGVDDVFQFVDEQFIANVSVRFEQMRADFNQAYDRFENI